MRRVILESPYAGNVRRNLAYAMAAVRDCLTRGEAPFASHLLYPQLLDDTIPAERALGIEAGLAWGLVAEATVVYVDLGVSSGMEQGIAHAHRHGRLVEVRSLPAWYDVWRIGDPATDLQQVNPGAVTGDFPSVVRAREPEDGR